MALNLHAVRAILYDLDGTLYEDDRHFELYAREVQARLPAPLREPFWSDWQAASTATHPALRVGTFYDAVRDLVLYPRDGQVVRALHWDGSELPPIVCRQLYPDRVEPDHERLINVGDLWWVPAAVSAHHGGDPQKQVEAFLTIRDRMSAPDFEVRPIQGLQETVAALRGRVHQVLVTNSPQPDSEAILAKVGLLGLLDRCFFRSNKPAGLRPILAEICQTYGIEPHQILSIGDNLVNEVAPSMAMGCQTILIDPHGIGRPGEADLIVASMSELLPLLQRRAEAV